MRALFNGTIKNFTSNFANWSKCPVLIAWSGASIDSTQIERLVFHIHLLRKYATCIYPRGWGMKTERVHNLYFIHWSFFLWFTVTLIGSNTGHKRHYFWCSTEGPLTAETLHHHHAYNVNILSTWSSIILKEIFTVEHSKRESTRHFNGKPFIQPQWSYKLFNFFVFAFQNEIYPILITSYWKDVVNRSCKLQKLLQTDHHSILSSLVILRLMNELTNERGFACLGLFLRGRLIFLQYAKLLTTQDFIQAPALQQTQWSVLWRPFGPSLILQDPVVNILRLIHLSSQINY